MYAKITISKLLILTCLLWSPTVSAQQSFSSLEERMTGQEFTNAGLDRLTASELEVINNWIRTHSLGQNQQGHAGCGEFQSSGDHGNTSDNIKYENEETIITRIKGEFRGWDGATVFELENGMIWVQKESGSFYISAIESPEVTIEPGIFNSWKLSVVGYNNKVKVERIQ